MLAVATREYIATVKTKAFMVALILVPLLTSAGLLLPLLAAQLNSGQQKTCAVVDETLGVFPPLRLRLEREQSSESTQDTDASRPATLPLALGASIDGLELLDAGDHLDDPTRARLSEDVRSGRLFAFVHIPREVLDPRADAVVTYATNTPTSRGIRNWLSLAIEDEVHRLRLSKLEIDPEPILLTQRPVRMVEGALYVRDGHGVAASQPPSLLKDVVVPMGAAFLLFMSVMLGATPLMQSTLEEKMHRITEVIVSSIPPLPLMIGKLLGAAAVSYTIVGLYLGGALVVATSLGAVGALNVGDALRIAFFQAIAFVMYGSIFLAVGSACNELKETQSLMLPAIMLMTTPLLLLQVVLDEPNGPAATWLSLFPFFTPPLMLLRSLVSPGAPTWQVVVGGTSSLAMAALCLWASSRVFRVGLLMQGTAPGYRQLLRWIRSG